jgi:hypothetical protein
VLPRENPYFAVSQADGRFEISSLPAGVELEFQVWQEKSGYLAARPEWAKGVFKVTIPANETLDLGVIKVPAALFDK